MSQDPVTRAQQRENEDPEEAVRPMPVAALLVAAEQTMRVLTSASRAAGAALVIITHDPRTAELHQLMPYKAPPDMSKFVLSPMPGLLVQVAVQPGQEVKAGERVAVIEAMKMENVLFASADGVVKEVRAQKGDSLAVDHAIVEFQ